MHRTCIPDNTCVHNASMAERKKRVVSDDQKAAMAEGRAQSRVINSYLAALEQHKPKRGRKRTPESIQKRLDTIDKKLEGANPVTRLSLIQERLDLIRERDALSTQADLKPLEDDFVKVAADYGSRRGISYAAWREMGVSADVLRRAGISRGSS
jgi:hypothetical protein